MHAGKALAAGEVAKPPSVWLAEQVIAPGPPFLVRLAERGLIAVTSEYSTAAASEAA